MNARKPLCPYPGTCPRVGAGPCPLAECPFRIHARRLVAQELRRLVSLPRRTPAQNRELAALKKEYARLLAGGKGGEAHGREPSAPGRPGRPAPNGPVPAGL